VQDCVIRRLHFNDLQVLIMSIDIANIKQQLRQLKKMQNAKQAKNIVDISQTDAVKFLKGGL